MPACAQCGTEWPDGYIACPDDGTRLSTATQPGRQTAPGALAIARARSETLEPGCFAGDYRIEAKIGEGGMGTVYAARHPLIGKRAAIKVLRRELSANSMAVERFVLEAQAVNQIGHPNIVDVFAFGSVDDGRSFIAMELLQGESLGARLRRQMSLGEAVDVIDAVAKALQAAHDAGVVHRDLKPDNIFLVAVKDEKPIIKLLDFGLAKLQGPNERGIERTRTGVVMGTPLYLSPEQARGDKIDAATDIYSLGAVAYEMLTGEVPFTANSAVEIMTKHITEAPRPPQQVAPYLPVALASVVTAMLEKDPQRRPSLKEVRERLNTYRSIVSQPVIALPTRAATAPPPRPQRRGFIIAIVGLATAAAVVITYIAVDATRGGRDEPAPTVAQQPQPPPQPQPKPQPPPQPPPQPQEPVTQPPQPPDPKPPDPPKPNHTHVPPKPTKKTGTVTISIAGPSQASITIDHKPANAGQPIELTAGEHDVRVEAPDFEPHSETIAITAGGATSKRIRLHRVGVHDPNFGAKP